MPFTASAPEAVTARGAVTWRMAAPPVRPGLEACGLAAADVAAILGRYASGHDPKAVAADIGAGVLLSKRSAKGRQKILTAVRRRFLDVAAPLPAYCAVARALAQVKPSQARHQLLLPYLLISDRGLHDIVHDFIEPRRRSGARLAKAELMDAVRELSSRRGQKPWSDSTVKRWTEGALSVLRDIGAVGRGTDREAFLAYQVRPEAFAFHLWGLYEAGYRGPALLDPDFWRLLLLRRDDLRPTARSLAERGWWRFTSIAGVDELRPAHASLDEWIEHGLG